MPYRLVLQALIDSYKDVVMSKCCGAYERIDDWKLIGILDIAIFLKTLKNRLG